MPSTSTTTKGPTTAPRTSAWHLPGRAKLFRSLTGNYSSEPGREFFSSSTGARRITEKSWLPCLGNSVNGINEPQRLLVRQKRLLHLVHDVNERDAVLGIGEGIAAAGA